MGISANPTPRGLHRNLPYGGVLEDSAIAMIAKVIIKFHCGAENHYEYAGMTLHEAAGYVPGNLVCPSHKDPPYELKITLYDDPPR